MNRPRNFKNRKVDLKMSSSTAVTSVVIGLIAGSCFKDSKYEFDTKLLYPAKKDNIEFIVMLNENNCQIVTYFIFLFFSERYLPIFYNSSPYSKSFK